MESTAALHLDARDNNFALLRLVFAAMVVVSHSPELIDGNRGRELLTRLFGTMSFGEAGVDGFFLISGYLITMSFSRSEALGSYTVNRTARIVPGYLAAFVICCYILAPLVGGERQTLLSGTRHFLIQTCRLLPPDVAGAFSGLPYPVLNGSMWTIAYEARCYILIAVLGASMRWRCIGVREFRTRVLVAIAILSLLYIVKSHLPSPMPTILGVAQESVRLMLVFLVGAAFYLNGTVIKFSSKGAIAASGILGFCMFVPKVAEPAMIACGGYIIFWFAMQVRPLRVSRIAGKRDMSYGLYLYAWPIQSVLIWNFRNINPWILCAATLIFASIAGVASWILVEAPALRFARQQSRRIHLASA